MILLLLLLLVKKMVYIPGTNHAVIFLYLTPRIILDVEIFHWVSCAHTVQYRWEYDFFLLTLLILKDTVDKSVTLAKKTLISA